MNNLGDKLEFEKCDKKSELIQHLDVHLWL